MLGGILPWLRHKYRIDMNQNNQLAVIAIIISVLSFLVSLGTAIWNIRKDKRDKGDFRLTGLIGKMVPDPTDKYYLTISVTNVGRRPVLLKGWSFKGKNLQGEEKQYLGPREGLPKIIQEQENYVLHTGGPETFSVEYERIYVFDAAGNEWDLDKKSIKELNERTLEYGLRSKR